jgi:RNase P/RNase MRP subunit p29
MKKSNVAIEAEIVKTTAKAVQIKTESGTFWFPKKNVEIDESGSVISVSKKMLESKIAEAAEMAAEKTRAAAAIVEVPVSRIVRESEKAVCLRFDAFGSGDNRYGEFEAQIWFPRSCVEIADDVIRFAEWLFVAKARDKRNDMGLRNFDLYAGDANHTVAHC